LNRQDAKHVEKDDKMQAPTTTEEFVRFALLPQNDDHLLEYIDGEVVERVQGSYASFVNGLLSMYIGLYVYNQELGYITGADCGYRFGDDCYLPSMCFVSKATMPKPTGEYFPSYKPDLLVEVSSPYNHPSVLRMKLWNYQRLGIYVWVIDSEKQQVEVYAPGQPPKIVGIDGTLDGGDVLPGFTLAVKAIFPE
jgi:Uma2 family endonuclease